MHTLFQEYFLCILSYIGPDCYVNLEDLDEEMIFARKNGFNIDLIRISNNVIVITNQHKEGINLLKYKKQQGSTGKGIAP